VFKARSIGGGGDANRECGLDCGDNLAEGGMVVIQLAGHCDECVGQVSGADENGAVWGMLADGGQQVFQVQALGGVLVGEICGGKQFLNGGGKLLVLGHGSCWCEKISSGGHDCNCVLVSLKLGNLFQDFDSLAIVNISINKYNYSILVKKTIFTEKTKIKIKLTQNKNKNKNIIKNNRFTFVC
jgi:hypothetical protein